MQIIEHSNILKEGWVVKESRFLKNWRRRWMVLTPSHIFTFKNGGAYKNPTESIAIKDCIAVKSGEDETHKMNVFKIKTTDSTFYIQAMSEAGKESWIGGIGKAMITPSILYSDQGDYA